MTTEEIVKFTCTAGSTIQFPAYEDYSGDTFTFSASGKKWSTVYTLLAVFVFYTLHSVPVLDDLELVLHRHIYSNSYEYIIFYTLCKIFYFIMYI